jgi:hypothetical protein
MQSCICRKRYKDSLTGIIPCLIFSDETGAYYRWAIGIAEAKIINAKARRQQRRKEKTNPCAFALILLTVGMTG